MLRKPFVLFLALALSFSALARTRATSHPTPKIDAATVHGVVTSINGNIIAIADGLVTIDASGARILVGRGDHASIADVKVGMLVFATVRKPEQANAPLVATTIAATRIADATLFGTLDGVDNTNRTITLLGRTVHLDASTSVSGELLTNQIVQVQTESVNGRLVATSVLVVAPVVPSVHTARGTVKSIAPDTWVIEQENKSLTLVIDAQTKIAGAPKVGDRVEVLYRVDASHANVAIAIARFEMPDVPSIPQLTRISGAVSAISATSWTIASQTVKITERTKIEPNIKVGDSVEALVEKKDDGSLAAILIMKRR
jgi:exosome complex RNA-binding protein Csl4